MVFVKWNIALEQQIARPDEQKDAAQVETFVAQRYIENPYLINGDEHICRIWKRILDLRPHDCNFFMLFVARHRQKIWPEGLRAGHICMY